MWGHIRKGGIRSAYCRCRYVTMKKIAVVYLSKFGHTKKYADWLKEELKEDTTVDVIAIASFNFTRMLEYKLVIFACGVYGDKLAIMDTIKKNIVSVPAQKTMIMAVSWYTNDSEEAKKKLIAENYPEQFKGTVPMYVVNSGLDKKQISMGDKATLLMAQRAIEKKDGRSSDDINALAIIKGYSDQTSKDNLESIKKGIADFFDAGAKADAKSSAAKPAAAKPASAPAKTPAKPAPAPAKSAGGQLSDSVEEAFKNLKAAKPAPKPAPEPTPAPEPAPSQEAEHPEAAPVVRFNSKGEVVVSSVVAAINSLNIDDPSQLTQNPVSEIVDEVKTITAEKSKPAPAPAPSPAASEDDLSSSVEEAFKHLNAPKAAPKPAPAPKPVVSENDLSSSVEEAFKHLNAPKAAPKPAHAPSPAVSENDLSSSVEEAFKHLNAPKAAPKPAPAPAAEIAPKPAVTEVRPEPVVQEVIPEPAPAAEAAAPVVEAPAPAAEEAAPAPRKNSYMEMFAKRRRAAETEPAAESAAEPAPAPAPEPAVQAESPAPAPQKQMSAFDSFASQHMDFDLTSFSMEEEQQQPEAFAPAAPEPSIGDVDMDEDVYDFLEDSAHVGSKRALTAVEDLAKAKLKAEQEAARLAAAKHAETVEEAEDSEQGYEQEYESVYAHQNVASYQDTEASAEEEEIEVYSEPTPEEEETDGLEAFAFTDSADYDIETEFAEVLEPEPMEHTHTSKTNVDIMKLQEEINASIESNRAAKEKLIARQNKQKEEVHNPFLVQFDEEEDEKKKKKKQAEPKRLEDPIDPDIFFTRTSNKGTNVAPGVMPEIKFRNH